MEELIISLTEEEYEEWRRTKSRYRRGVWIRCYKCGKLMRLTPFLTFIHLKRGVFNPCPDCRGARILIQTPKKLRGEGSE